MNRTRRLASWRLVAMLVVVSALAAGTAFGQTMKVRVKVGPANVYDKARTSSDVVMTVQEGTVLDALNRAGTWYWVLLPPDANGVRRGGYIAAYLVEQVSAKGVPQLDQGTRTGRVGGREPAVPVTLREPRYFFGVGGGGQTSSPVFADTVTFPLYDESGQYRAVYSPPRGSALDVTVGLRLSPSFVLGLAFWRSTSAPNAAVTAIVPHPFVYDAPRAASANDLVVGRSENDGHLQLTWLVPVSRVADLSVFAGPSLFYLREDFITALTFRETYPYDAVTVAGLQSQRSSKIGFGANAGADLTVMVWRYIGVGIGGRYARGKVSMTGVNGGPVSVKVGGAQVSGGVRLRF